MPGIYFKAWRKAIYRPCILVAQEINDTQVAPGIRLAVVLKYGFLIELPGSLLVALFIQHQGLLKRSELTQADYLTSCEKVKLSVLVSFDAPPGLGALDTEFFGYCLRKLYNFSHTLCKGTVSRLKM